MKKAKLAIELGILSIYLCLQVDFLTDALEGCSMTTSLFLHQIISRRGITAARKISLVSNKG